MNENNNNIDMNNNNIDMNNNNIIPIGIQNPGNFCYIISALQAMFNDNVINEFIFKDNLLIDNYLNKIIDIYELNNKLLTKKDVNIIINNKFRELLILKNSNPDEYNNILNKIGCNEKQFMVITIKLKNEIYPMYIYKYFLKIVSKYNELIQNKNKLSNQELLSEIFLVFKEYLILNNKVLGLMGIDELVDGQQHDSQEYILTILDILNDSHTFKLQNELEPEIAELTEAELNKLPLDKRIIYGYKKTFYQYNKNGYTTLKKKLYFYTVQFIDCRNCKFKSISYQENSMLSLPIPELNDNDDVSIYDCLNKYFGLEVLEHDYKCEQCSIKQDKNILSKKILTRPDTIIIFLKRFNFNMKTMTMSKNNTKIIYPQILNINKYFINKNNNDKISNYKLKSIICHYGLMNYGHYYTYISKNISGIDKWFICNDEKVNEINVDNFENDIVSENAYILFYEKI